MGAHSAQSRRSADEWRFESIYYLKEVVVITEILDLLFQILVIVDCLLCIL